MMRSRRVMTWTISVSALLATLTANSDVHARPRLRPVRIKDADTLFLPGNANLLQYPRLNNRNQVVFINTIYSAGRFLSRLWDQGHLYPLGGEGAYHRVTARALNDSGEVAGEIEYVLNDTTRIHAFATVHGQIQELQSSPEEVTIAYSLNNQGVATGRSIAPPSSTVLRAIRWDGGIRTQLGPLPSHPPDSQHYDFPPFINDAGTIAGNVFLTYSAFNPYHRHGFYGTPGAFTEVVPFAGGYSLYLWDINNPGQMVGESDGILAVPPSGGYTHAILVDGGQKKDIHGTIFAATRKSTAYAVNDSGAVVGWWEGGRPLYYDNDTTWLLDSLLATRTFAGGGTIGVLWEAIDINNSGVVLALYSASSFAPVYPCLLVPVDSGTIVNTANDLPDLNPGDGRCYTGNVTALGEDECSLRAAIQHSNAHPGVDTVRFRIPGAGVPLIAVGSTLPAVTEQVVIDGTTQPGSKRVEVSPQNSLVAGDGLVLTADHCSLRGLLINRFGGSGLVLDGADFSRVDGCHFGVRSDSTTPAGNGTAGVFIMNAFDNQFGNLLDGGLNFVAHNGGPGILIASGSGNNVFDNHIFRNGGLGIDLVPLGVTLNDPEDADAGANELINYPYFDSVVTSTGTTHVFGTVTAGTSAFYTIQLYRSDTCDTSGYGEGQEPVTSGIVLSPTQEAMQFEILWPDTLLPGEALSMTATSTAGNTSEFSPCWPMRKKLYLVDGTGAPLIARTFALARVAFDPPTFTETFLDSVTTDFQGAIDITQYYDNGSVKRGDSVKVGRILERFPRDKGVLPELRNGRIVELDNGGFDSLSHDRTYDELDAEPRQVVRLEHTTLRLNLLVSVEWEADPAYLALLGDGFRELSSYLYDVTDGQCRLDTVVIFNNHLDWTSADIAVQADNSLRPNSIPGGLYSSLTAFRLNMGRRWFGTNNAEPDLSLAEWPLHPDDPVHFRTIGHELGHYAFRLLDEYKFGPQGVRCSAIPNFGMMDTQYETGGLASSELSWSRQYADPACRNNEQWLDHGKSCWGALEAEFQGSYDGIHAEILTPQERNLAASDDYFYGPNEPGSPVQVDVGALTTINTFSSAPRVNRDVVIQVGRDPLTPASRARVSTQDQFLREFTLQGRTSSNGGIRLLGVRPGDSVFVNGRFSRVVPPRAMAAADSEAVWWSAAHELPSWTGDSLSLNVGTVSGYLPALVSLQLNSADADLGVQYLRAFGGLPDLSYHADADTAAGSITTVSMFNNAGSYQVTLDIGNASQDVPLVRALDDSGRGFQFAVNLAMGTVDTTAPFMRFAAADGSASVQVDSAAKAGRLGLAATDYLVIRTGLDSRARQVGKSASVSSYPGASWSDRTVLTLTYEDGELSGATSPFDLENTLQMFAWNTGSNQWELLGGSVDTTHNEVAAVLPGPGLYAAFTTGQVVGVEDEDHGAITPDRYELSQNHPNPFNPSTTISYYLPVPGRVNLRVHNILGQTVRTLVDEFCQAGRHEAVWDGRTSAGDEVGSGVYFYQLRVGEQVLTRRMVLVK